MDKTIAQLLEQYEPALQKAFQEAIDDITSNAQLDQLTRALQRGDVNAAIEALYIDRAVYQTFESLLDEGYVDAGNNTVGRLPTLRDPSGNKLVVRFNARNPRAEQWLSEHSSALVTRTIADQREAIRQAMRAGMERGENPNTTALDITGRINRTTGKREGGIVGLTVPQERAAENARRELANGDYEAFMKRKLRDKRFDRTLQKAVRDDTKVSKAKLAKILSRYRDGLLRLRGRTIARTEALIALHQAQHEALTQLVEQGKIKSNQIRRTWDATMDNRTRRSHAITDGQTVGLNELFVMPSGATMRFPGDPLGPAEEVINCRCWLNIRIDFLANVS